MTEPPPQSKPPPQQPPDPSPPAANASWNTVPIVLSVVLAIGGIMDAASNSLSLIPNGMVMPLTVTAMALWLAAEILHIGKGKRLPMGAHPNALRAFFVSILIVLWLPSLSGLRKPVETAAKPESQSETNTTPETESPIEYPVNIGYTRILGALQVPAVIEQFLNPARNSSGKLGMIDFNQPEVTGALQQLRGEYFSDSMAYPLIAGLYRNFQDAADLAGTNHERDFLDANGNLPAAYPNSALFTYTFGSVFDDGSDLTSQFMSAHYVKEFAFTDEQRTQADNQLTNVYNELYQRKDQIGYLFLSIQKKPLTPVKEVRINYRRYLCESIVHFHSVSDCQALAATKDVESVTVILDSLEGNWINLMLYGYRADLDGFEDGVFGDYCRLESIEWLDTEGEIVTAPLPPMSKTDDPLVRLPVGWDPTPFIPNPFG